MTVEFSEYEKEKWFDQYNRFKMDSDEGHQVFLTYGDELGEAFNGALYCTDKDSYGLEDWFVAAAQRQVLDMYYYQMHLYTGEYGGYDTAEELGLPPINDFINKVEEFGGNEALDEHSDIYKRAWDWAMEWRDEHLEEHYDRVRKQRLEAELARLK